MIIRKLNKWSGGTMGKYLATAITVLTFLMLMTAIAVLLQGAR